MTQRKSEKRWSKIHYFAVCLTSSGRVSEMFSCRRRPVATLAQSIHYILDAMNLCVVTCSIHTYVALNDWQHQGLNNSVQCGAQQDMTGATECDKNASALPYHCQYETDDLHRCRSVLTPRFRSNGFLERSRRINLVALGEGRVTNLGYCWILLCLCLSHQFHIFPRKGK